MNDHVVTDEQLEEARELRRAGYRYTEIAAKLDVDPAVLRRLLSFYPSPNKDAA